MCKYACVTPCNILVLQGLRKGNRHAVEVEHIELVGVVEDSLGKKSLRCVQIQVSICGLMEGILQTVPTKN